MIGQDEIIGGYKKHTDRYKNILLKQEKVNLSAKSETRLSCF